MINDVMHSGDLHALRSLYMTQAQSGSSTVSDEYSEKYNEKLHILETSIISYAKAMIANNYYHNADHDALMTLAHAVLEAPTVDDVLDASSEILNKKPNSHASAAIKTAYRKVF